jgi:predicted HTH domain antitoxin
MGIKLMNKTLQIQIPADLLITLNETEEELGQEFKLYAAIWLYALKKLTIGKAIQLSGLTRPDFEKKLMEFNLPIFNTDIKDYEDDRLKLANF